MPTEDYTERILRFVGSTDYRPQQVRALARTLGIGADEYGEFRDAVKALMKSGRLVLGSSKVLTLPERRGQIIGKFRLNPRGFGFVIPNEPDAHGDLFVPPGENGGAITGDTVIARVSKRGKRGGKMLFEGRITQVVKRGQNHFVGELCKDFGRWFVRPDGNTIHTPVFVDDPGAKSARAGDQVVIEILRYPDAGKDAHGVIVRVLGERGRPEVDTLSMIVQYQYPEAFEDAVLEEARRVSAAYDPEAEAPRRTDLRDLTIVTIDPDDARDFDDAISLEKVGDGLVELGVHIADVSHFVTEGSILDAEALARSTSVYFPKYVIPMLPEVLSNGVCSLQEGQPRLTKSAFITYDRAGAVQRTRFASGIIHSAKRLTYGEATAILEGKGGRMPKKVVALLREMDRLARVIRKRRLAAGMLVLDLPEMDLIFDAEDNVVGTQPADTSFSHTIIEMFMVEANEAVSRLFAGRGVPHLRRIHPEPDAAAGESLTKFLAAMGVSVPKTIDRFALQAILKKVKGKPAGFAANLAVLRSLERAEYSPRLEGHYALASEHYAHFTSPIRRYPDLTIHRLLDRYLRGELETKRDIGNVAGVPELTKLGEHCSTLERRAEDAERELRLVKILRLIAKRLGDEVAGVVTGVTNFGLYVQLPEYLVDGLLRFNELSDDWWEVDADAGCVVAERSGQRIAIGQTLQVVIAGVDIAARQIDLAGAGAGGGKAKASRGGGSRGGKGSRSQGSRSTGSRSKGPKGRGASRGAGSRGAGKRGGPKAGGKRSKGSRRK
ncbi:MAG TPA: ribonuclease R [Phycisphaerae bacterium]|nr:ribonuclease R [Phycisphaerae bacterium]